jgi:hypothetical protein
MRSVRWLVSTIARSPAAARIPGESGGGLVVEVFGALVADQNPEVGEQGAGQRQAAPINPAGGAAERARRWANSLAATLLAEPHSV